MNGKAYSSVLWVFFVYFFLMADAFFTCRKNVLLAKSTSTQIEGIFAATRGKLVQEEQEALLQQWLEEGAGSSSASESAPVVGNVSAASTSTWLEGSELLMSSLSDLNSAPEVVWCANQQLTELCALTSSELQDHAETKLEKLPAEETVAVVGSAPWAALVPQADPQIAGCATISVEGLNEDPAVLAWSLTGGTEMVPTELPAWPAQDAVQFCPLPAEVPYHGQCQQLWI